MTTCREFHWTRHGGFPMLAIGLTALLLVGCARPTQPPPAPQEAVRPNPLDLVDQICIRSLNDDIAFVRELIAPGFLEHASGARHAALPETELIVLMHQLRLCRPVSLHKTDHPDRVTVGLVGVKDNTVRQFRMEMTYDAQRGWQIAGSLYDEKPIEKSGSAH